MKKLLALLLALVTSLALCACGKENIQDAEVQNVPQTQEMATTTSAVNTELTEPQIIEIELTAENWQEYFDTENVGANYFWIRNSFDEVEGFISCNFFVPLKEEYQSRITNLENTEIAYEISGVQGYRDIMVDIENEQVSLGDEWEDDYQQSVEHTKDGTIYGYNLAENGLPFGGYENYARMGSDDGIAFLFEVSNLVRIKGAIYLFAE